MASETLLKSLNSESEDTCDSHDGEVLIAHEACDQSSFGCNKCVYEGKLKEPVFLLFAAKQTKQLLDSRFVDFKKVLKDVEQLQPELIEQKITRQLNIFFEDLHRFLRDIEKDVFH